MTITGDTEVHLFWPLLSSLDDIFIHWIPNVWIPLYTLAVISYITIRYSRQVLFLEEREHFHFKTTTPKKHALPDISSLQDGEGEQQQQQQQQQRLRQEQPINLTGNYKLVQNDNFEEFLKAQGVPWFLVSAANKARPIHKITHNGQWITIQIQGIIESETTYQIEGPPVENVIRGRRFQDQVTYLTQENADDKDKNDDEVDDNNVTNNQNHDTTTMNHSTTAPTAIVVGIQTQKRALDDGYTVCVKRQLSRDKSKIIMNSHVAFDDPDKPMVKSKQIFERIITDE
jgi:hypothetical protein